jgi:hypothetical protein
VLEAVVGEVEQFVVLEDDTHREHYRTKQLPNGIADQLRVRERIEVGNILHPTLVDVYYSLEKVKYPNSPAIIAPKTWLTMATVTHVARSLRPSMKVIAGLNVHFWFWASMSKMP